MYPKQISVTKRKYNSTYITGTTWIFTNTAKSRVTDSCGLKFSTVYGMTLNSRSMTSQSCPRLSSGSANCTECLKISFCEYYRDRSRSAHLICCGKKWPREIMWEFFGFWDLSSLVWDLVRPRSNNVELQLEPGFLNLSTADRHFGLP